MLRQHADWPVVMRADAGVEGAREEERREGGEAIGERRVRSEARPTLGEGFSLAAVLLSVLCDVIGLLLWPHVGGVSSQQLSTSKTVILQSFRFC